MTKDTGKCNRKLIFEILTLIAGIAYLAVRTYILYRIGGI